MMMRRMKVRIISVTLNRVFLPSIKRKKQKKNPHKNKSLNIMPPSSRKKEKGSL